MRNFRQDYLEENVWLNKVLLYQNKATFKLGDSNLHYYQSLPTSQEFSFITTNIYFIVVAEGEILLRGKNENSTSICKNEHPVILKPHQDLTIKMNPDFSGNFEMFILEFNSADLELAIPSIYNLYPTIPRSQANTKATSINILQANNWLDSLYNILRISHEANLSKKILFDLAFKELLVKILHQPFEGLLLQENSINHNKLHIVKKYIQNNIHQKLSIDAMAELISVSKSNFFKLFKKEVGISPNEFILKERISLAKTMLLRKESIKEVAFLTGFSDTNYFTRVFKAHEGTTPKLFQKK